MPSAILLDNNRTIQRDWIIGSGLAGLAAGQLLQEAGHNANS